MEKKVSSAYPRRRKNGSGRISTLEQVGLRVQQYTNSDNNIKIKYIYIYIYIYNIQIYIHVCIWKVNFTIINLNSSI